MTEIVRELQMDPSEEHEEEEEETQDGWEEAEAEWSEESNGFDEPHMSEGLIGLPGTIDPHALEDMVADSSLALDTGRSIVLCCGDNHLGHHCDPFTAIT